MKLPQNTNAPQHTPGPLHYVAKRLAHVVNNNWELTTKEAQDMLDTVVAAQDSHRDLLQELESAEDGISRSLSRLRNADYDDGEHPAVSAEILALHAVELAARAAIAKARGLGG